MNGGFSQYARVLQDAMRPVPPVTARPIETIDPLLFVNSTPEAWNEIMRAKYGPDWEQSDA